MGRAMATPGQYHVAQPTVRGAGHVGIGRLGGNRAGDRGADMRLRHRQRGMALITAILLVALATIMAATIGYENAMTARRGSATFAFEQSLEIAKAAEAIAAFA